MLASACLAGAMGLGAGACDVAPKAPPPEPVIPAPRHPSAERSAPVEPPPGPTADAPVQRAGSSAASPRFRVARRSGEVKLVESAPLGAFLATGTQGSLAIDLRNGARVELAANTRALVLAHQPASLLLLEGAAHASLPPTGAPVSALRLATEAISLASTRALELWLQTRVTERDARAASATYAAILTGEAALEYASTDAARHVRASAPQAVLVAAGRGARIERGPKRLVDASAAASARLQAMRPAAEPAAATTRASQQGLHASLAALDAELVRGPVLLQAQRSAAAQRDQAQVRALQRDLVTHAQQVLLLRGRVVRAYELAAAVAWRTCLTEACPEAQALALAHGAALERALVTKP